MSQSTLAAYIGTGDDKEPCPTCGDRFKVVACHHWQAHGEKLRTEVECDYCGETLRRKESDIYDRNYCNERHMYAHQQGETHPMWDGQTVTIECDHPECDETLTRGKSAIEKRDRSFHSQDCYWDWLEGKYTGRDNPFYRGGRDLYDAVKNELDDIPWKKRRERAKDRDGRECQNPTCDGDSDKLDTHHIVPILSGGTNGYWNLMTLCTPCHMKAEAFVRDMPGFEQFLPGEVDAY